MTQPAGPPGPYQMPTPTQPTGTNATKQKQPSAAGYWIGGGILVVGCGIAVVWFVVVVVGLIDAPSDFERVPVPGTEVVTLDEGDWTIYYETTDAFSAGWGYDIPNVIVTGPSGRDISVGYSDSTYAYQVDGRSGESLYEFRADTPGAYTIETESVGEPASRSNGQVAIGRPMFGSGQVGGILGSLALGAVAFIVGLVVLIVTIVRRSRAKRVSYPTGYGPGPYGGVPYGQPPYGQPPYGQPPYGQPPYGQPTYGQPPQAPPPFASPPPAPSAWPSAPSPTPSLDPSPAEPTASQPGWASPQPAAPAATDPEASAAEAPPPQPEPQPGAPPPGTSPWYPPDDPPSTR